MFEKIKVWLGFSSKEPAQFDHDYLFTARCHEWGYSLKMKIPPNQPNEGWRDNVNQTLFVTERNDGTVKDIRFFNNHPSEVTLTMLEGKDNIINLPDGMTLMRFIQFLLKNEESDEHLKEISGTITFHTPLSVRLRPTDVESLLAHLRKAESLTIETEARKETTENFRNYNGGTGRI